MVRPSSRSLLYNFENLEYSSDNEYYDRGNGRSHHGNNNVPDTLSSVGPVDSHRLKHFLGNHLKTGDEDGSKVPELLPEIDDGNAVRGKNSTANPLPG